MPRCYRNLEQLETLPLKPEPTAPCAQKPTVAEAPSEIEEDSFGKAGLSGLGRLGFGVWGLVGHEEHHRSPQDRPCSWGVGLGPRVEGFLGVLGFRVKDRRGLAFLALPEHKRKLVQDSRRMCTPCHTSCPAFHSYTSQPYVLRRLAHTGQASIIGLLIKRRSSVRRRVRD